ncbi:hypothetical protein T492DRAFT_917019 [Pavlovales sp. CCMP2436]|nr:hypothetical protein T492DRAFT_917019 [Pavlovales sp. CCMP2436]
MALIRLLPPSSSTLEPLAFAGGTREEPRRAPSIAAATLEPPPVVRTAPPPGEPLALADATRIEWPMKGTKASVEMPLYFVDVKDRHHDVEADFVTVRNRETSKARVAKFRASRKRAAAANVAPPTAAALPSGTSAFSLKQNGEPRKNERAAVVAKSMRRAAARKKTFQICELY